MGGFEPPDWASDPKETVSLEVYEEEVKRGVIDVDKKPFYTIGRDASSCDIPLDDKAVSRMHAAIVHHRDGRCFVIDLKSTRGTSIDGDTIPGHKPIAIRDGMEIRFGSKNKLVVRCATGGASGPPKTVIASHLLVKHRDSRRPASWKDPVITRSKEEALEAIQGYREQIVSGTISLAVLATTESDCSSAKRGGDLGPFGPGMMQAAFEKATFALKIGELSEPIFTDSGVHLILRTG